MLKWNFDKKFIAIKKYIKKIKGYNGPIMIRKLEVTKAWKSLSQDLWFPPTTLGYALILVSLFMSA